MSADSLHGDSRSTDVPPREPLDGTVVRYRDAPDRCTVAPPDVDSDRELTAWLSVNADALVALTEMR